MRSFRLALALAIAAPWPARAAQGAGGTLTGAADPEVDRRLHENNQRGVGLVYDDRYDEAVQTFEESIRIDPASPTGHVLLAATYQSMMHEYRSRAFLKPMKRHLDLAIDRAQRRIDAGEELGRSYQFLGAAYGNLGLYHALQGNWFRAFRAGQELAGALEAALRLRPEIADSDYGYGFYLYWRTVKASIFKWLAGWGDMRDEGIRRLDRAARQGELCGPLARQSLLRVYLNERRYFELHAVAATLVRDHPNGITPWWWQGQAYLAERRWADARRAYTQILKLVERKRFATPEAVAEARYGLAVAELGLAAAGEGQPHRDSALATLRGIARMNGALRRDHWVDVDVSDLAEERLRELGED